MISSERSCKGNVLDCGLPDVSLDRIYSPDIKIFQKKTGYRFNSDSIILSWFVFHILKKKTLGLSLEIGSGTGIVPIVLNRRGINSPVECVEIQNGMFDLLVKNIELNGLTSSLTPINANFKDYVSTRKNKYDLIFTNPPYFGTNDGKINPENEKAVAKHEFFGSLSDFITLSSKILNTGGHFIFIYPLSRIHNALSNISNKDYVLNDIYLFRENPQSGPSSFCAHFVYKGQNTFANTELITIRDDKGNYSSDGQKIMYEIK